MQAQNLVPNPSFEEYHACPTLGVTLGNASYWTVPEQGLTPDYFNRCSTIPAKWIPENVRGWQEPVTGDAYMGIECSEHISSAFQNVRDAVSVSLKYRLEANELYVFRAYFSRADLSAYSVATIGYKLSEAPLSGPTPIIDYEPTYAHNAQLADTSEWMMVSDTITAIGNERYLTIANFMSDAESDTVYIGPSINGNRAYYYVDDVWLSHIDSVGYVSVDEPSIDDYNLSIYPNPNDGQFNVQLSIADEEVAYLEVFNVAGERIHSEVLNSGFNTVQLQVAEGLYLYRVSVNDEPQWTGKLSVASAQ